MKFDVRYNLVTHFTFYSDRKTFVFSITVHLHTPPHTSAHLCTPLYASAHLCTHIHASAHLCTPLHTSARLCTPLDRQSLITAGANFEPIMNQLSPIDLRVPVPHLNAPTHDITLDMHTCCLYAVVMLFELT